jgi:arsenate reductase-like glutaredoxin family protein
MNFQLLTIETGDGCSLQYPQKFLADNCQCIADLVELNLERDDNFKIPFTREEINAFLGLLQTRRALSTKEDTLKALRVADYLLMNLTNSELNQIVADLSQTKISEFLTDSLEQVDEFVKTNGHLELNIPGLIQALENPASLRNFTGLTRVERYDRLLDFIELPIDEDAKDITLKELLNQFIKILPYHVRWYIILLMERVPSDAFDNPIDKTQQKLFYLLLKTFRNSYLKLLGEEFSEDQLICTEFDLSNFLNQMGMQQYQPLHQPQPQQPGFWQRVQSYWPF